MDGEYPGAGVEPAYQPGMSGRGRPSTPQESNPHASRRRFSGVAV